MIYSFFVNYSVRLLVSFKFILSFVADLKEETEHVSKKYSKPAIGQRHYPRGLRKSLRKVACTYKIKQ